MDFWTDDFKKHPYLSITAHFIDDKWRLRDMLIGVFSWDPAVRQTGENIQKFLFEVRNAFPLLACLQYTCIVLETQRIRLRRTSCGQ